MARRIKQIKPIAWMLLFLSILLLILSIDFANISQGISSGSGCTAASCPTPSPSLNDLSIDVESNDLMPESASDIVTVVLSITNPHCLDHPVAPSAPITYIVTLNVTEESFSISPQATQHFVTVNGTAEMDWLVQPKEIGYFALIFDVQAFLGDCLVAHRSRRFRITATNDLGVDARGVMVWEYLKIIGAGIVALLTLLGAKWIRDRIKQMFKKRRGGNGKSVARTSTQKK